MDKRTAQALELSIAKWDANSKVASLHEARIFRDTCALCNIFPHADCSGCPVAERTGLPECEGSPWVRARYWHKSWEKTRSDEEIDTFRAAAIAERDFLISLREPVEEANG